MTEPSKPLGQSTSVELEPADPFELIRWLARSQPDPRKAMAELVQNSIDASATHIHIRRARSGGAVLIRIRDDGEGVLPKLSRRNALLHLASHIGHSHKLQLDPGERARRVVAGQYGVGLLGFWSIGGRMEIHSRVGGGKVGVLRMIEDSPHAEVGLVAAKKGAPATYTEVVVADVHASARRALSGRRMAAYLATELRGQLLRSGAEITIEDRLARGAHRELTVEPYRFTGERLELPETIAVPGYRPAKVELYLARGLDDASIELACAGTRVADDITELDTLGLGGSPWSGAELSGVIDFPDFSIPPGTRRGVLPNDAALAFLSAMSQLGPRILSELERLDSLHRAELDRQLVGELRRALRGFDERVRDLSLPTIGHDEPEREPPKPAPRPAASKADGAESAAGPLHELRVAPHFARISPGKRRRVRAIARDAQGRPVTPQSVEWRLPGAEGAGLSLEPAGLSAWLSASEDAPVDTKVALMVVAVENGDTVADIGAVQIVEEKHEVYARLGIPEPVLVNAPGAAWRSRRRGFAWEINDAHPDFLRVADQPKRRLRYLVALLAKEIVIGSTGREDAAELLEAMVQVMAHAEGNLR